MTATAVASALSALIDRVRRTLKTKTRTTSEKIQETIATLEAQLATRADERAALEREWSSALLESTPADQRARRETLAAFDDETEIGRAALEGLRTRLTETIAEEANDEATRRITRQLDRAAAATVLIPQVERQMRELAATLLQLAKVQRAWAFEDRWLHEHAPARREAEVLTPIGDLMPRRFFNARTLLDGKTLALGSIVDDRRLWPPRREDLDAPDPEAR